MSLLLDALKKAADDKEKKSREESEHHDAIGSPNNEGSSVPADELTLQHESDVTEKIKQVTTLDLDDPQKLSLDSVDVEKEETVLAAVTNQTLVEEDSDLEKSKPRKVSPANGKATISDDALSLLIHKTNHDVKRGKRVLYSSILIFSLLILVAGGIYYYIDMESEIDALERKHSIAMQSMRSKTNREETPDKTEIIRNLVSDTELEEKVEYAKKHMEKKLTRESVQASISSASENKQTVKSKNTILSIERTDKVDLVGKMLDDAWMEYEAGHYLKARQLYKDVLVRESDNRDALLGLGAIAVIEKDKVKAREAYLALLDLDPRDPIAAAALASLHSDEASLSTDEEYLLSMLKKNPKAPHLNFALGNIYAQSDKWVSAQQYYFSAWQQDDSNADYIFNLAVSMDQLNKQQQALDFYKDSLKKSENKQVSFSREAVQQRINELIRL